MKVKVITWSSGSMKNALSGPKESYFFRGLSMAFMKQPRKLKTRNATCVETLGRPSVACIKDASKSTTTCVLLSRSVNYIKITTP